MTKMVRCAHCGGTYNLYAVTVTARYSDCSVWKTPCCDRTVDDRSYPKDYYPADEDPYKKLRLDLYGYLLHE